MYLALRTFLREEELKLGLPYFVEEFKLERANSSGILKCLMSTEQVNFFEYIFTLFQQTVEKKIHFSVIFEAKTDKIEKDEYYGFKNNPDERGTGLQIHMKDLEWIISEFNTKVAEIQTKKVKSADSQLREGGKYWEMLEATNKVEYLHWLLKLLIPVNFLGGYLNEI